MKLCKCNNCGNLYEDTNPQTNQREYDIPTEIQVEQLHDHNCPECKTDGYLIDFNGEIVANQQHKNQSI